MKFNEAWLRTFSNPEVSTEKLVAQLTMAGLEVDSVTKAAPAFTGIVVGEVLGVEAHPNADKLRICQVSIGEDAPLNIVCGASNVRPSLRVPVATIGAVLPGDFKIKQSKLRGEPSFGMLCSEQELGLADSADGLMELPVDAPIGTSIREYLNLDDAIIEIDLTPNRADCLSVEGVAREVGLLNQSDFNRLDVAPVVPTHDETLSVAVEASEACPRYLGRLIKSVDAKAETPEWMQERLRRAGQRSLSPLVDVTNYVLIELGQPLHAFDVSKLSGGIQVRMAEAGETLELLNDQTIELTDDVLVIADDQKAAALAGIMGGSETAVDDQTQNVFLECAFFSPSAIMGKARQFGLHTDSSHRFERGVDPELQLRAIDRATQLILDICGGEAGPVTENVSADALPIKQAIELRSARVQRLLGVTIEKNRVTEILTRLEMNVEATEAGWRVVPPSFRFDIAIEADLIEELARVYGYDALPQHRLSMASSIRPDQEHLLTLDRIKDALVDRGYQEAVCYSFVDEAKQKLITPDLDGYALQNPISSDMSVMRTSLWVGLLDAVDKNIKRNQEIIRFFESGLSFVKSEAGLTQESMLAGVVTGRAVPEQWDSQSHEVDFYDLKSDVETLLKMTGRKDEFVFKASQHPALHPGQTAELLTVSGESIGFVGLLHPALEKKLGLDQKVYLFELKQQALLTRVIPKFVELSKYQAVRRDIALVVDADLAVQSVVDYISQHGRLIRDIVVFDVYQGQGVESGRKSIALGLILQDYSKTLVDQEVDDIVQNLVSGLAETFGARLRD